MIEQSLVDRLFLFIKRTTIDREVHLKNRSVLDIYKMSHKLFNVYQKQKIVLLKEQIQTFADGYKKQLTLFEEDTDSDYYLDYQELLDGPLDFIRLTVDGHST